MSFTSFNLSQVYWHAPNLWPMSVLAAALMLAAILWLYPAQLSGVRWPWRALLPGLRILAVLLLAFSGLKPIAMRLATLEEQGAVVVLVDRSRSMAVVDNTRTPAQLVALADALGKLPAGVRGDSASALLAGMERLRTQAADVRSAQEDLEYARVSGRDIESRRRKLHNAVSHYSQSAAALLDKAGSLGGAVDLTKQLSEMAKPPDETAGSMWRTQVPEQIKKAVADVVAFQDDADRKLYENNPDVQSACNAVARLSRFALVEQALLWPGGVVSKAKTEATVIGFGMAADITPLTLQSGGHPAASLDAAADGDETDITACIAKAVAGRAVRTVVLFSDGRQVGGDKTQVSGLTPEGVPVFAVSAAAADPPHDLSFASVSAPSSVFAGQSITVKADIRNGGFDGENLDLHCQIGEEKEQVRQFRLQQGKPVNAEFSARLSKPGVQRVRLWFPAVKGEASEYNNQAERWVKVVPDRLKVLLLAGSPTWDFQLVRTSLSHLPEVQLKDVVLDPANPRFYLPSAEILSQDVIILFDVPAATFDEKHWDAVERAARVGGGSVVLVAGDGHLPAEYLKLVPTASLLPFRSGFKPAWSVWPLEDPGFHFVPAPDAEALEMFKLPQESGKSDADPMPRRWEQLPACFRFLQLPEIHDEKNWKPQVRPLLLEEESRLPVLTEMRLGAGRAFFLGINETWRWRFKIGGRDQDHFWRQLVQYASENPYFAHDGALAMDIDKVSAEPGEMVHVRARLAEETAEAAPAYTLSVYKDKKLFSEPPLSPIGVVGGGRFAATLALPAGDYDVLWTVPGASKKPRSVKIPLHVAATSEAEMADLSGDPKMLQKLAEASGGEFLTLDQVDRLPERLAVAGDARSRYAELPLWDSPYLFIVVVGCLGIEWGLRKRLGLA